MERYDGTDCSAAVVHFIPIQSDNECFKGIDWLYCQSVPLLFFGLKIWIVRVICVSLPVVTTNQRCIGCQSSMRSETIYRNNLLALSADGVPPRSGSGSQGTHDIRMDKGKHPIAILILNNAQVPCKCWG